MNFSRVLAVVALAVCIGCESPSGSGVSLTVPVTEAEFDGQVLQSELPVLVDFWAKWCGPCRAMEPVLDSVAERFAGQLVIAKVDVEENPGLAARYQISGIPAMLLFQNGEVVEFIVGGRSETDLATILTPYLSSAAETE